jgi:hypothetical protein
MFSFLPSIWPKCLFICLLFIHSLIYLSQYTFIVVFIHPLFKTYLFLLYIYLFITSLFAHLLPCSKLLTLNLLILYVPYIRGIYEPIQLQKAKCALASVL